MKCMRTARYSRPVSGIVLVCLLAGLSAPVLAQTEVAPTPASTGDSAIPVLAVLQVTNASGSTLQNISARASSALAERFANSGRFKVVGHDAVDKALAAVGAPLPLRADPHDGYLGKLAEQLKADYLVLCSLESIDVSVAQKLAVVRSISKVYGRVAQSILLETEVTALNLDRRNVEAALVDDALEQNALQTVKDVAAQSSLLGRIMTHPTGNRFLLSVEQPDYMRPGALLAVRRNGLKIATLRVERVGSVGLHCETTAEIIFRDRPDMQPAVNDEVSVYKRSLSVAQPGATGGYDPGTGQVGPTPKPASGVWRTVLLTVGVIAAVALGVMVSSQGNKHRTASRTPQLVAPSNGAVVSLDSSNKLLTPVTFQTTAAASADAFVLEIATDANFNSVVLSKSGAGTPSTVSTNTGSSSGSGSSGTTTTVQQKIEPYSLFSYTPELAATFLSPGAYFWRVKAVSVGTVFTSPAWGFSLVGPNGGAAGAALPAPSLVRALPGNSNIQVQWTPVSDARTAAYHVYRRLLTPRTAADGSTGRLVSTTTGRDAWLSSNGRRSAQTSARRAARTRQSADGTLAGFTELARTVSTATSYLDTAVTNGVQYEYVVLTESTTGLVSALNSAGTASFAQVTPLSASAPAVPTGLTAVAGNQQVVLTWTANAESDLAGYQVIRSNSASFDFAHLAANLVPGGDDTVVVPGVGVEHLTTGQNQITVTDSSLSNGVTYYYRLRAVQMNPLDRTAAGAVRGGLVGSWSDAVQATPSAAAPQELQLISPLDGAAVDIDRPSFSWRGIAGVTQYTVQVAEDRALTKNVRSFLSSSTEVSYPAGLAALTLNTTYYVRVSATDPANGSQRQGPVSSFLRAAVQRYAVTVTSTRNGLAVNGATLSIDGVQQLSVTPVPLLLTPKALLNGNPVAYHMTAAYNDPDGTRYGGSIDYTPGVDPPSVTIPMDLLGMAPLPPTGLTATGQTDQIVLRWNPDPLVGTAGGTAAATQYSVRRRANSAEGDYSEIAVINGPTTTQPAGSPLLSYTDRNVAVGVRYFYRLVALNSSFPSLPSTVADAVAGVGTIQVVVPQDNQSFDPNFLNGGLAWDRGINFVWIAVPNAQRYIFEIGHDQALHYLLNNYVVPTAANPTFTYTFGATAPSGMIFDGNLAHGTVAEFYWRVIAVDDQNRIINQTESRKLFLAEPALMVKPAGR